MTEKADRKPIDPFGEDARHMLLALSPALAGLAQEFSAHMHDEWEDSAPIQAVLARLLPDEREWLLQKHADHLMTLLSPDTDLAALNEIAERAGNIHIYTGVDLRWAFKATADFKHRIYNYLSSERDDRLRQAMWDVVRQRLDLDLDGQMAAVRAYGINTSAMFHQFNEKLIAADNHADLIRNTLEVICDEETGVSALYSRRGEDGGLRVEQYYGPIAEAYFRALEEGQSVNISTIAHKPSGEGPGGRAWRAGEIQITDAWLQDPTLAPWRSLGRSLGIRASAAIPILDASGRTIALLGLYSPWPGYFSNYVVSGFLQHIQVALGTALHRIIATPAVPVRAKQTYRRLLTQNAIVMVYQPIIDLGSGELVKLEALARLRADDTSLLPPGMFLPSFGNEDLFDLFEKGLAQVCIDIPYLKSSGVEVPVSLNFPGEGFDDPRYEHIIKRTLVKQHVPEGMLHLELLETSEGAARPETRVDFMSRMKELGVRIIQDDLGSGHSSLLRLDRYPFDEVKIEQGLVRGALNSPKRVVEFILYLTRLAHAFGMSVTVEGLENKGLIEAAMILGADHGQGYGIAMPMPVKEVPAWLGRHDYKIDPNEPETALGTLAAFMLWDMLNEDPEGAVKHVPSLTNPHDLVARYIRAHGLQGGSLDRFYTSCTASPPADGLAVIPLCDRARLVEELTQAWIEEVAAV